MFCSFRHFQQENLVQQDGLAYTLKKLQHVLSLNIPISADILWKIILKSLTRWKSTFLWLQIPIGLLAVKHIVTIWVEIHQCLLNASTILKR